RTGKEGAAPGVWAGGGYGSVVVVVVGGTVVAVVGGKMVMMGPLVVLGAAVTGGAVVAGAPLDTTKVTVSPLSRRVPGSGSVRITSPAATVALCSTLVRVL